MSEHGWFEVGTHGPPDPDEHPWVCWRKVQEPRMSWSPPTRVQAILWRSHHQWYPVDAPPTEPAPRPEPDWVEVDGRQYRLTGMGEVLRKHVSAGVESPLPQFFRFSDDDSEELRHLARVAAALGLVGSKAQWVTDRLPDDDEYPVLCNHPDPNGWDIARTPESAGRLRRIDLTQGWRWMTLSDLLGEKP